MGAYTRQELLLLSNFVYIPACRSDECIEDIIDRYRDDSGAFSEESVAAAAAGGGMSTKDVCTVFTEMDKRIAANPEFGRLSASRRLEEKDVRAVCYTNDEDSSPVVAFRGTGGTKEAWVDNFEGAFREDTKIQKIADDFIRYECAAYDDIVVTGHSKGGNLAQYVTVKREENVGECVSFDGQGFGDVFISENSALVQKASPKITSISAYNDFVNILLTGIAGTYIYVANDESAEAAHSPTTLLTSNTFDENGNFTSVRSQGIVSKELSRLTAVVTDALDPAKETDKETLSIIAGSAISLALTTPRSEVCEGVVAPVAGIVAAGFAKKIACAAKIIGDNEEPSARSVYFDAVSCREASYAISRLSQDIGRIGAGVDGVRQNMAYTINTQVFAESTLAGVMEDLAEIRRKIGLLSECIDGIANRYERAECEAAALMYA